MVLKADGLSVVSDPNTCERLGVRRNSLQNVALLVLCMTQLIGDTSAKTAMTA